jgi:predicted DNA-binding protein (MmcQ/YjbR family)
VEETQTLRAVALRYPGAEEAVSCAGTALESASFKARGKAFLFIGKADVKVKLRDSLAEAAELQAAQPGRIRVGAHGWTVVAYGPDRPLPVALLERWIDESFRAVADKRLVAELPPRT